MNGLGLRNSPGRNFTGTFGLINQDSTLKRYRVNSLIRLQMAKPNARSKIAKPIQAVLKFDVNGCRGIAAQEEHKLHETRVCRSKLRVRNLVVDDPFGVIGETVKNKDVAASHLRVPYVPLVKNELAVNPTGREFRRRANA